jgi:hypothetical protein
MWRSVKRAAEAAARSAGRGSAASASRASAPEARASAIARVARDGARERGKNATSKGCARDPAPSSSKTNPASRGRHDASTRHDRPIHERCVDRPGASKAKTGTRDQRRRSMHAEGLVRLRRAWELELAAEATRRSSPATALEMIGALRRAGVPWSEIVKQRAIREGVMRGADGIWSVVADAAAAATAPATKAAKNLAASARAMVPTLALRHAGGSWSDVVSHPAFRFLGRERHEVMKALFVSGPVARTPARAPLPLPLPLPAKAARLGPRFPELREELVTFISSSKALRHAGCSWLDVARHASFHACVRARVVAGGYSVYLATFVRQPFTTAVATSVFKCVASDVFVQKFVEGRDEIDTRRVFCFFTLGLTYVGAFQYGLYNRLMKPAGVELTRRLGTGASVAFLVAVDQFLVCPLFYLPAFFGLKSWAGGLCDAKEVPACVAAKSAEALAAGASAAARVARGEAPAPRGAAPSGDADDGSWRTLVALWAYWVPAQAINFWVVPRHLTIPFMNLMGFGWNGIMSAMNGAELEGAARDKKPDAKKAARDGALAAAAPEHLDASASGSAPAMEECLADERCVRALALASSDALAIANIGVAEGIVETPAATE